MEFAGYYRNVFTTNSFVITDLPPRPVEDFGPQTTCAHLSDLTPKAPNVAYATGRQASTTL